LKKNDLKWMSLVMFHFEQEFVSVFV
jgi:hypothetical protein